MIKITDTHSHYDDEAFDGTKLPSFEEVLVERLGELNVPVITDADVGHKGPQFVMINGAIAEITVSDGKGRMVYL